MVMLSNFKYVCTCFILGLVIYEYKLGDAIIMLHIFNNMHNILQKLLHITYVILL